jgi:hypothetical protein
MSRRVLVVLAIIVLVIIVGMVLSVKRAARLGTMANDPDPGPARTAPATPRQAHPPE